MPHGHPFANPSPLARMVCIVLSALALTFIYIRFLALDAYPGILDLLDFCGARLVLAVMDAHVGFCDGSLLKFYIRKGGPQFTHELVRRLGVSARETALRGQPRHVRVDAANGRNAAFVQADTGAAQPVAQTSERV